MCDCDADKEDVLATHSMRVGLAQIMPDADIGAAIASAAKAAADVVVFLEMFSNGYSRYDGTDASSRASWIDGAVVPDGEYVKRFRDAARKHGIAVVATFLERAEPKPFNAAVLIDSDGEIVLQQRKRHICHFDIPEDACAPGDRSSVARLSTRNGDVTVGIMICMDREFPDVASDLVHLGAEVIFVPNSSPLVDDREVGDVRVAGIRAMAFQSVVGVAVANYPAPKNDGRSLAVDPLGRIVCMAGEQTEIAFADFDLEMIRATQQKEWFRRVR